MGDSGVAGALLSTGFPDCGQIRRIWKTEETAIDPDTRHENPRPKNIPAFEIGLWLNCAAL